MKPARKQHRWKTPTRPYGLFGGLLLLGVGFLGAHWVQGSETWQTMGWRAWLGTQLPSQAQTLKARSPGATDFNFLPPDFDGTVFRWATQTVRVIEQNFVEASRISECALFPRVMSVLAEDLKRAVPQGGPLELWVQNPDSSSYLRVTPGRPDSSGASSEPSCWSSSRIRLSWGGSPLALALDLTSLPKDMRDSLFAFWVAAIAQWASQVAGDSEGVIFRSFMNEILASLDPHSNFLSPSEYEDLRSGTRGQFGGVGVVINDFHGMPFVREIIPNSPAQMAGIEPNDVLLRLGKNNTASFGIEAALSIIRTGTRAGPLEAWFFRPRSGRVYQSFISRDEVQATSVEERWIPEAPDILHLRVSSFSSGTSQEIYDVYMNALRRRKGALRAMILDLRGNPGGLLDQAVQVSDLFLADGKIVVTKSRYDLQAEYASANQLINLPLAVIINSSSASASEIVAGALKDAHRAVIIGERSFGKGSVQSLFEIPGAGALKLTIAHYFTPSGRSIQNTGVEPHVGIKVVQVKRGVLWAAGSSEKRRESDLTFHLENPDQERGTRGPQTPAPKGLQGRPAVDWIWSSTSDDLSELGFMGQFNFTYPNYENTDHRTRLKEDSFARVAVDILRAVDSSREGIWSVPHSYREILPRIRARESAVIKETWSPSEPRILGLDSSVRKSPLGDWNIRWDPKSSDSPRIRLVMEPKSGAPRRFDPPPRQVLVGFAVAGEESGPSMWSVAEVTPLAGEPRGANASARGFGVDAEVPRLFWTAWSSLKPSAVPRVDVFLKMGLQEDPHVVGQWVPSRDLQKALEHPASEQIETRVVELSPSPASPATLSGGSAGFVAGVRRYAIRAEFQNVPHLELPCEIVVAPMVERSIRVTTSSASAPRVGCPVWVGAVEVLPTDLAAPVYRGMVGLMLRDKFGIIRAQGPVLEVLGDHVSAAPFKASKAEDAEGPLNVP